MVEYIYSKHMPNYIIEDIKRFWYKFKKSTDGTVDIIGKNNVIFYENELDFIFNNIDLIGQSHNVIFIDHHFIHHEKMLKLDDVAAGKNLIIFGTQYLKNLYKNIKC